MDSPAVAPFRAASMFFVEAVAAIPPARYGERWSDEWRVLDLIGHGNRAHLLPVEYYERPVPVAGPGYADPANVAERARQSVVGLGDDPVAAVRRASQRVLSVVDAAPNGAMVGTPFGEQTLDAYLRSRTAELVVHGLDLGAGGEPPREALAECARFLASRAVSVGRGEELVRALTGRGTLPPGFNVY